MRLGGQTTETLDHTAVWLRLWSPLKTLIFIKNSKNLLDVKKVLGHSVVGLYTFPVTSMYKYEGPSDVIPKLQRVDPGMGSILAWPFMLQDHVVLTRWTCQTWSVLVSDVIRTPTCSSNAICARDSCSVTGLPSSKPNPLVLFQWELTEARSFSCRWILFTFVIWHVETFPSWWARPNPDWTLPTPK